MERMMKMFQIRLTRPEAGNKYYIRKASGGWSPCIQGKPLDPELNVLANCVGYAVGRFNEIGKYGACRYLGSVNAENMAALARSQGLTVLREPTPGGCMVWAKGAAGNSSDGAGHVAIVEQVNTDGSIITSESGYGYKVFYTSVRSGANWGESSAYQYLGCIVNPAVYEVVPVGVIRKGDQGSAVRWLQNKLVQLGYLRSSEIDGDFGKITLGGLLAFQFENGLEVDGVCGPLTKAALIAATAS